MTKPILYSYFRSSASYRVRIALHLKKIDFEYKAVHLTKDGGQQNALNYKAVNPMSQVPTLVDGMNLMSQSMAIIQYIDDKWSQSPQLFPKDPYKKALVIEVCELINSGIQPLQNLSVLQKLETDFKIDSNQKDKWCQHFIAKGFEALEKKIAQTAGKYCFGGELTAADCFLVPQVFGAIRFGLSMDAYPTLKRISETLGQLEAFKRAHPSNQPDTPIEN